MPKTLDSYLADRVLTRQLYLMRFSAGEQKKVLAGDCSKRPAYAGYGGINAIPQAE